MEMTNLSMPFPLQKSYWLTQRQEHGYTFLHPIIFGLLTHFWPVFGIFVWNKMNFIGAACIWVLNPEVDAEHVWVIYSIGMIYNLSEVIAVAFS